MVSLETIWPSQLAIVAVVEGDPTVLSASKLKPYSNCAKTWMEVLVDVAERRRRQCCQFALWAMEVSRLCVLEYYTWFNAYPSMYCLRTQLREGITLWLISRGRNHIESTDNPVTHEARTVTLSIDRPRTVPSSQSHWCRQACRPWAPVELSYALIGRLCISNICGFRFRKNHQILQ